MSSNPFQSPEPNGAATSETSRIDRFRQRMKAFFRLASLVFALLAVAGAGKGAYHLWHEYGHEITHELSVSMLVGAAVTGTCAGMLYWISKRL